MNISLHVLTPLICQSWDWIKCIQHAWHTDLMCTKMRNFDGSTSFTITMFWIWWCFFSTKYKHDIYRRLSSLYFLFWGHIFRSRYCFIDIFCAVARRYYEMGGMHTGSSHRSYDIEKYRNQKTKTSVGVWALALIIKLLSTPCAMRN